jgi:hypothetical protein
MCCLFLAPGCAPIPGRVAANLRQTPQRRDPLAGSSATTTASDMIIWKQPYTYIENAGTFSPPQVPVGYSIDRCGGQIGTLFGEWKDVAPVSSGAPPMQLVRGRAAASEFSGSDYWGTHRFRDWNVMLVVDNVSTRLLAPANYLDADWDDDPIAQVLSAKNPELENLFELEWDTGFFPPEMAPDAGDETLAVGRWIFDCGHEGTAKSARPRQTGFRSEIHAPAILISSHLVHQDPSLVEARFKIFAGSRGGPLDTVPVLVLEKYWTSHQEPLGGQDYSIELRAPQDGWKIASCKVVQGAEAGGRRHKINGILATDGGESLTYTVQARDFKPTDRIESSIIISVSWVPVNSSPGEGVKSCG